MAKRIYQLSVQLKDCSPKVWRRVQVYSTTPLSDLHQIVQTVMGWSNSQNHRFMKDGKYYFATLPSEESSIIKSYAEVRLSTMLRIAGEVLEYEYDFKDRWIHEIKLERIVPMSKDAPIPLCVTGRLACPPESCGGIEEFGKLHDALTDDNHPDYAVYKEKVDPCYQPRIFDKKMVNEKLDSISYSYIKDRD